MHFREIEILWILLSRKKEILQSFYPNNATKVVGYTKRWTLPNIRNNLQEAIVGHVI
jgi:hypothetical protein